MTSWDEPKRRRNIKAHGLDFEGSEAIWDNFTVTREDVREDYGESRLVTFGIEGGAEVRLGTHLMLGASLGLQRTIFIGAQYDSLTMRASLGF